MKQKLVFGGLLAFWIFLLYGVVRTHNKEADFILPIFTLVIVVYLALVTIGVIKWSKSEKTNKNKKK